MIITTIFKQDELISVIKGGTISLFSTFLYICTCLGAQEEKAQRP